MNKNDFINEVAKRKGITPRKAYREVNDVMDTLRVILSSGEEVQLGGFGTFEVLTDLRGEPNRTKENHLDGSPLFAFYPGKAVFGVVLPRVLGCIS